VHEIIIHLVLSEIKSFSDLRRFFQEEFIAECLTSGAAAKFLKVIKILR
jgi:hypothetical protein